MNRYVAFTILILTATTACSRQPVSVAAARLQPPVSSERVETITVSEIVDTYRATGTVRARETAAISARIMAAITDVRVRAGDHVKAGQALVILDRRDMDANLRRAEAAHAEAESAICEAEHAVVAANASLELARVTQRRFDDLLARASVSQQEADESQARLRSASATVEIAVSKRRQAEARLKHAEAELASAHVSLGYATLAAPFAGLVTERKADPGTLAIPGAPLLTLEREGNLRLEASIDESRSGVAGFSEQVTVEIDGLNRKVSGRVTEIVPSVDAVTRSFTAKIDLPALPGLRAGMFGRAAFADRKREALLIPETAVVARGQIRSVYVVEANIARLRFVTLGAQYDKKHEVLSGLKPGETIVVKPPAHVFDGQRVAVQAIK